MRIVINDDNVVIGYSTGNGRIAGYVNIEVNDIPSDFAPYKYKYINGEYELNPDYVEPTDEPTDEPSADELLDIFLGVNE